MADFESKAADLIKEMMTDPAMSEKIKDIMGMLGGTSSNEAIEKRQEREHHSPKLPNVTNSLGNFGGMDINLATIQKFKKIYDSVMTTEDPRINLLNSLKPYLNEKRMKNLDNAMKIVQITKFANVMGDIEKV